ncbi:MAG: hypothetical protein ACYTGR_18950, partial [Planctomycetota bacterium]
MLALGAMVFATTVSIAQETPPVAETAVAPAEAETPSAPVAPRPLDHDAADRWNRIESQSLSRNGAWVLYRLVPGDGNATLVVRDVSGERSHTIERGARPAFSADTNHCAALIEPDEDELKAAKKAAKKAGEDEDEAGEKQRLVIVDLNRDGDEARLEVDRVTSFAMPEDAGGWIAWLHMKPPKEKDAEGKDEGEGKGQGEGNGEGKGEGEPAVLAPEESQPAATEPPSETTPATPLEPAEEQTEEEEEDDEKSDDDVGTELIVRNLSNGAQWSFADVTSYVFSNDGAYLLFTTSSKDLARDGAWLLETGSGTPQALASGAGRYTKPVFDESSRRAAFLAGLEDDGEAEFPDEDDTAWT